ncbi:P-loop NTPase fold protein [Nocardia sp. NPDC006982]|uniref:P-loop NTPase fold protein n=1 Tax=Nocardia sp. NPDC006982 TaxID=3364307 RepID=UPI0036BA7B5B
MTDASVSLAISSAIGVAAENKARRVGVPLLGAGALAEPASRIAAIVVPALVDAQRQLPRSTIDEVVYLASSDDVADPIEQEFNRIVRAAEVANSSVELAGGVTRDLVDPSQGIPLTDDELGFAPYVSMLATVIADRETPLPLSVGIFGKWGSGKSYFMAMLRDRIRGLANSGDTRYQREIVQIGFNAWHYADSNLWASLGDEIFRQLAEPELTSRERSEQLRTELVKRLDQRRHLEMATQDARVTAAALQEEIDRAIAQREASAADLIVALRNSAEFGSRVDGLWRQLGISDQVEQAKLFAAQLQGTLTEAD